MIITDMVPANRYDNQLKRPEKFEVVASRR